MKKLSDLSNTKKILIFGTPIILVLTIILIVVINSLEKKESEIDYEVAKKGIIKSSRSNPNGPYYHQVYIATSTDGVNWTKQGKVIFDHASVPGAVIKDGIIYLYFVDASEEEDQLSVGISKDLGESYTKYKVEIEGMPSYDVVDPHPELVDSKIRLYYLGDFTGMHKKPSQEFTIYSAVSNNGINFTNQKVAYQDSVVTTDPDVFQTNSDWRMLLSQERNLILLISSDGGLTFKKESNFSWDQGGVCDTFKIGNEYQTYFCRGGISRAIGANSGALVQQSISGLDDRDEPGKIFCDPSVIQLPDGTYLMFYKVQEIIN